MKRAQSLIVLCALAPFSDSPAAEPRIPPGVVRQVEQSEALPPLCPRPSGAAVAASEVLRLIESGEDVDLSGRVIEGSLEWPRPGAADSEAAGGARRMTGALQLDAAQIGGNLALRGVVVAGNLSLHCTEVRGGLDLGATDVRGKLDASRMIVVGPARLENVTTTQELTFGMARFEGGLDLSGARIGGAVRAPSLQVAADLTLRGGSNGGLFFSRAHIGGATILQDLLVAGGLSGGQAEFMKGLTMSSVRFRERIDLADGAIGAALTIRDLESRGPILISPESCDALEMTGVRAEGGLSLWDGRFKRAKLEDVIVKGDATLDDAHFLGPVEFRRSTLGERFSADETEFRDRCLFASTRIPGDDPLSAAHFRVPPTIVDAEIRPPARENPGEDEDESDD